MGAVAAIADVFSAEYDGMGAIPHSGRATPQWEGAVLDLLNKASCGIWSLKPYRPVAELMDCLGIVTEIPWSIVDSDWKEQVAIKLALYGRLVLREKPFILLARALPWFLLETRLLVRDQYKTIPADKDSMEWWQYEPRSRGGFWVKLPTPVAKNVMENVFLLMLSATLHKKVTELPQIWLTGTDAVFTRLPAQLYDVSFCRNLHGTETSKFIQFSDGAVMWSADHRVENGKADLLAGHCTKYPFPEAGGFVCVFHFSIMRLDDV
jgi:hypothetical protein